jgi:tetratricopeptide (TPR) repeat protein
MGEPRSHKQQREQLVRSLRAAGKSRVEVAEALRQRYRFNARVALRYAHEWSQRQAADEWNQRWPDELKTFKTFSYWEQWPSSTGHAPTFDNLSKLAELYECAVSDLLVDLPDFRHRDTPSSAQATAPMIPQPDAELIVPSDVAVWATATGLTLPDTFVAMLMHYLASLAPADREARTTPRDRDRAYHQLVQFLRSWAHTMDRRDVLGLLAWAAAVASAFPATVGDEHERALAHEAENTGLGAFVLCEMSHLATWQGRPRIGIDHAVAAGQWADRADDIRLRAYTADVAARAYAADGQRDPCVNALDTAHTVLTTADDHTPSYTVYNEAIHISIRGGCHLELGEADRAVSYAQQSLELLDRSRAREVAMTIVDLAEVYVQCNEIDEAARLLGDAGDIVAGHSSVRLIGRLEQARAGMQPWQHTAAVRTLDDRLAAYGLV